MFRRLADLLNLLTVASVELAGGIALALGQRRQASAATEKVIEQSTPQPTDPAQRKGGRRRVEGNDVIASFIGAHFAKHGHPPSGRELIDRFPTIPRSTLYWHRSNDAMSNQAAVVAKAWTPRRPTVRRVQQLPPVTCPRIESKIGIQLDSLWIQRFSSCPLDSVWTRIGKV
jgi:hypothetical protein